MPLARIITRSPEDTIAASEYLRSQGFTVETVSPGEFRVTPAEFELNLDRCSPEEGLARAKARLESPQDAAPAETTAVSAQHPEKAKVPVAYDIAGRPVEFAEEEEILLERRQPNGIVRALVAMLARAKLGIAAGLTGAWQSVREPIAEFQRGRAEQRALELDAELAQEREEVRHEEELARERLRQEMERQRQEAGLAERQRQERIAAENEAEDRRRIAAEKAAAEQREQAERAAALAAQQEQARIEAERQANALRAPQEAVISAAPEAAPPAPVEPKTIAVISKDAAWQQLPRRGAQPSVVRRRRGPIAISRKAVATAFGASLLLLLGFVAYANRRPASPFSAGDLMKNQSVKQDTPFGAATITPPPTASKPSAAAVTPAKTSPAVRPTSQKPRSTQRSARRLRRESQDDSVAEDEVVVRHRQAPRSKQPTPSTAKLKRYSDAE